MPPRTPRSRQESFDPHLSPQSELPRGLLGHDRSGPRNIVREMTWAQFDEAVHGDGPGDRLLVSLRPRGGHRARRSVRRLGAGDRAGQPFHPVRILGRSRDPLTGRMPQVMAMPRQVKGARILLVDDVVASGLTMGRAIDAGEEGRGASDPHRHVALPRPGRDARLDGPGDGGPARLPLGLRPGHRGRTVRPRSGPELAARRPRSRA